MGTPIAASKDTEGNLHACMITNAETVYAAGSIIALMDPFERGRRQSGP